MGHGKFTVTQSNLTHENHNTDKATYDHYPENLRLPEEKLKDVERLLRLGVNKQKLKADLEAEGLIVPLKILHNIQNKMNRSRQNAYTGDDELQKLLQQLREIPNATVRIVTNEDDELIGRKIKKC